jgi:hypothetical protein
MVADPDQEDSCADGYRLSVSHVDVSSQDVNHGNSENGSSIRN